MLPQPLHLLVRRNDLGGDVHRFDVQLCADLFVVVLQLDDLLQSLLLDGLQLVDVVAKLLVQLQDGQVGKLVGADLLVDEDAELFAQRGVLALSNLDFLKIETKKKRLYSRLHFVKKNFAFDEKLFVRIKNYLEKLLVRINNYLEKFIEVLFLFVNHFRQGGVDLTLDHGNAI